MQAAPSSGGATRGKLPSSKVNAVIVTARNDAGAESACLLRTLRFKVPNDLTTYSMGCHFECDGLHFGCVSHSDVSFAGNPEHLCTWTHDGEARRAVGLDAEKVDDVPINPTRAALLMKMPFAVAVPEWWTLLPLPLTEYRLCVHAKNMLEGLVTLGSRRTVDIYDPRTKSTERHTLSRTKKRPATRKKEKNCEGCDFVQNPKKKNTGKNQLVSGLCRDCYKDAHPSKPASTTTEKEAPHVATPSRPDLPPPSPPPPSASASTSPVEPGAWAMSACATPGCAAPGCGGHEPPEPPPPPPAAPEAAAPADSAAYVSQLIKDGKDVRLCRTEEERSMFWRQRYLAAQKKVIRRDASTSKGDEKRKRQADTIVQLESELDSQAEAAQELRDREQRLARAEAPDTTQIWSSFMEQRGAVEALNADMHTNGLEYQVPERLQPIFTHLLREVFLVTEEEGADSRVLHRAKSVLAQQGFHFFSQITGRARLADGRAPPVLNGLQTRMAMLVKEGDQETALAEAHEAGLTIAGSTADQKLAVIAADAEKNLQINTSLSQVVWVDNFEAIYWRLYFEGAGGTYQHAPVDPAQPLPAPWDVSTFPSCSCGHKSACDNRQCDCVKAGLLCNPRRCRCPCCLCLKLFAGEEGVVRGNANAAFMASAAAAYKELDAEQQKVFNPICKTQDHAEAKETKAHNQICKCASYTANVDDSGISWTRQQLVPRKTLAEVSAADLEPSGFREDFSAEYRQRLTWFWAKVDHADTKLTPEYLQTAAWRSALSSKQTRREKALRAAYDDAELPRSDAPLELLQHDDVSAEKLALWRQVYLTISKDDHVQETVGATVLIRRIVLEQTALADPATREQRGARDAAVLKLAGQNWLAEWGTLPDECVGDGGGGIPAWSRSLLQLLRTARQSEEPNFPRSFRKIKDSIAAFDLDYLATRKSIQEAADRDSRRVSRQRNGEPEETAASDTHEGSEPAPPTSKMMPLYDGTASSHRVLRAWLEECFRIHQLPSAALPGGVGQYLPYSSSGDEYVHLPIDKLPPADEGFAFGSGLTWSAQAQASSYTTRIAALGVAATTPVPRAELPRHLILLTDFAIYQHFENFQAKDGLFGNLLLVPEILHYCFAALDGIVRKHYSLLSAQEDLQDGLNISSERQLRYVVEPTADVRKMLRALEQYAIAIGVRAKRELGAATLSEMVAKAKTQHDRQAGKTTRLCQELDFVHDFLIVDDLFAAGHDGDYRRVVAAFIQLGPLLLEASKPNKCEEHLSHMMRLAMMSEREYHLVTRRCLFHEYRGGEKVVERTPQYDKFGASKGQRRTMMNGEDGEDKIGRMKESGAFSESQLIRRSKLFNYLEQQKAVSYRKRHKSSSTTHQDDPEHLVAIASLHHQLSQRPAASRKDRTSRRQAARLGLHAALERRKISRRRPIAHKDTGFVSVSFRQMVSNLRADKAAPVKACSAADYLAHDHDPNFLRRDGKGDDAGVPGKGDKVDWLKKFSEEISFCVTRSGVSYQPGTGGDFNNFGKSAAAARHHVRQARGGRQAGALVGTATELRAMITPKFLHETPLGPATRDVTQPCLDPFPEQWTYQPPPASAATSMNTE